MNVSALKSGDLDYVRREFQNSKFSPALRMTEDAKRTLVKVIIDTPFLTDEEKITACEIARDEGADFVKTSTALRRTVQPSRYSSYAQRAGPSIGVKAAGGIRTIEHAMDLLDAGAIGWAQAAHSAVQSYNPETFSKQHDNPAFLSIYYMLRKAGFSLIPML